MLCRILFFCMFVQASVCVDQHELDKLYEQHIDNPKKLHSVGRELFNSSQYEQALPFFKKAYEYKPDAYLINVWHTLWRLNRYEEARTTLEGFISPEKALEKLDELLFHEEKIEPSLALKAMAYFWALGRTYKSLGKREKAQMLLESALRISEIDNLKYWWYRGNIYGELHCYNQAIESFEKVLGLLKQDDTLQYASMHFNIGHSCIKSKRYEEAVMHLQEATLLNPKVAQYYDSLGTAYMRLKQPREAKRQFVKALQLHPKLITALDDLGNYYAHNKKFEKAKHYFHKALSLNPRYSSSLRHLGRVYLAEGNADQALSFLYKAREYATADDELQIINRYIERAEKVAGK